jgi:hypothetical protein
MNAYITLDGFKYATIHKQWAPTKERPVVIKKLLSGGRNVTFGPSMTNQWAGVITVPVTPATGYGAISDLRATYAKLTTLTFVDHYGVTYSVVIDRHVGEASLTPVWDAGTNMFQVNITLVQIS